MCAQKSMGGGENLEFVEKKIALPLLHTLLYL